MELESQEDCQQVVRLSKWLAGVVCLRRIDGLENSFPTSYLQTPIDVVITARNIVSFFMLFYGRLGP
jgi:hypothetical protein